MVKDILINLAIVLLPVIAVAVYLGGETVQTAAAFLILATFGAVIAGVLLMIWLSSVFKLINAFKNGRRKK